MKTRRYRYLMILLLSLFWAQQINAQVFENPEVEQRSHHNLSLTKVKCTDYNTILYMEYEARENWKEGFNIDPDIILRNPLTGKEAALIKAEGIPLAPEIHEFDFAGQKLSFRLIFPLLSENCTRFSLLESRISDPIAFKGILLGAEAEEDETDVFRGDYNYMGILDHTTGEWETVRKVAHTFVFNINANGDVKHFFQDGDQEILRSVSEVERESEENYVVQKMAVLNEEGLEMELSVFSNGILLLSPADADLSIWFFTEGSMEQIIQMAKE